MFTPLLDILPAPQLRLWPELARVPAHFVLYGGTAIALQLGHRASVDFDFFSDLQLDEAGKQELLAMFGADSVLQNQSDTLVFTTEVENQPVKLSFFGGMKNGCVAAPRLTEDGVACVASLDDLMAHKLKAIHDRAEGKDYQDLAVMLMHGQSLARGLAAKETLFGTSVPSMLTLKALSYFDDVSEPDRITPEMKKAIIDAVRDLPKAWEPIPRLSGRLAVECARSGASIIPPRP